jgi:two-component system, sensor histidine kinase
LQSLAICKKIVLVYYRKKTKTNRINDNNMNVFLANEISNIQEAVAISEISDILEIPDFKNLIELTRQIFDIDYAFITYFTQNNLRVTDEKNFRDIDTKKSETFCAYTIKGDEVFVVEDALLDPRFVNNPYVKSNKKYRFYAGAPLDLGNNNRIGTICIMDIAPRKISIEQKLQLKLLATQVVALLKLHKIAKLSVENNTKLQLANDMHKQADTAIQTMNDGLLIHDDNLRLLLANPSALRFFNRTQQEVIGLSLEQISRIAWNEDLNEVHWWDFPPVIALKTALPNDQILCFDCENRGKVWIQLSSRPLFEKNSKRPNKIVTTFTDITETRHNIENLRDLNELANQANKAKSAFLANMSHEIRTPLNGVIGVAAALERTKLLPNQREMVDLILSSGRTLETLLSDILDLSKVEAGQIKLENMPFSLRDAANSTANLLRLRADEKGLEFKVIIAQEVKESYFGDVVRIRQIIANLASNAIKFTQSGYVALQIDIKKHNENCDTIILRMIDTGIGMDEIACANVFERFTQADNTITRRFGGTGLGLSITKGLVEIMNGSMNVQSQIGKGTIFTIEFALEINSDANLIQQAKQINQETTLKENQNARILFVEDHPMNQKVFSILAAPFDFDISYANNGQEGVEAFANNDFDIVFMDMQMPVLDGLRATRKMREIENTKQLARTPIVMLTANAGSEHAQNAKDAGADFHLTKPMNIDALVDVCAKCLNI